MDPVHMFPERYVNDYGQIPLPLTDVLSVKCVSKKLFCFSFEFNENWWNCSYLCILKLHQVSMNSNGKGKSLLITHLMDSFPSIKGRWIWPLSIWWGQNFFIVILIIISIFLDFTNNQWGNWFSEWTKRFLATTKTSLRSKSWTFAWF